MVHGGTAGGVLQPETPSISGEASGIPLKGYFDEY